MFVNKTAIADANLTYTISFISGAVEYLQHRVRDYIDENGMSGKGKSYYVDTFGFKEIKSFKEASQQEIKSEKQKKATSKKSKR